MNIDEELKAKLLKTFNIGVGGGEWAIIVNGKPIHVWNRWDRWATEEQARAALDWHCEYGLWLEQGENDANFYKYNDIVAAIDSLLKDGAIKIEKIQNQA